MSAPLGHNGGPPISGDSGWVAIARAMRAHPLVGFHLHAMPADANRGAMQPALAWIDLIMECRYTAGVVNNNGRPMRLERGQLLGATSWLADRWNWTPKAVRGWLGKLETAGMIAFTTPAYDANTERNDSKSDTSLQQVQLATKPVRSPGRSKGRFANVISICNYALYQVSDETRGQVVGPVEGQDEGRLRAGSGQVEGRLTYIENARAVTKEQDNKEKKDTREDARASVAVPIQSWVGALNPQAIDPDFSLADGRLSVLNGARADWLARFGGDDVRFDLALIEIAAELQPNARQPLRAQVERGLARRVADKLDKDRRYEAAARRNARPNAGPASGGETQAERFKRILAEQDAKKPKALEDDPL